MKRGDIRWYTFNTPDKKRPVLVLTRDSAIEYLHEITIAPITSTVRNIPSEVYLDKADGMPQGCAVNFDHIQTVPKERIGKLLIALPNNKFTEVKQAIIFALGL